MAPALTLDDAELAELADHAEALGLLRLGAVRLDHPGLAPARAALADYLDRGLEGEMAFMTRTRELRGDPAPMLAGARSALVALVPYGGEAGPIARYAQWADYHTVLHQRLQGLVEELAARKPGIEGLICVDTKPVLERALAVLAGLGFLGKNGCLIAPGLGSYVLIGLVLCTAEWTGSDRAPKRLLADAKPWDACGSCRACLEGCPTAAFEAPGRLDPRRCIAYLTIEHRGPIPEPLADALGERVAGCDLCQEVCPYNAAADREERIPAAARLPPPPGRPRVADLARLATIGNNQHRQFVKRTALNRIPRRALRRNAILALGNGEGALPAEARSALEQVAAGEDTELAELARRALERRP